MFVALGSGLGGVETLPERPPETSPGRYLQTTCRHCFGVASSNHTEAHSGTTPLSPTMEPSRYLTVKQAAELVGKSKSAIRRAIYPIVESENHPDRDHIRPGIEEATALRMKGLNFPWQISEEILRREFPIEANLQKGSERLPQKSSTSENAELIAMLRVELDIKNQQIATQSKVITSQIEMMNGLSARLQEGNVLIATFQQRFLLAETKQSEPQSERSKNDSTKKPEKGNKMPAKPLSKIAKPKKSFFSRLFRG